MFKKPNRLSVLTILLLLLLSTWLPAQIVPLPEHPRPDWERKAWQNLNGTWSFQFDPENKGLKENWQQTKAAFPKNITVPFSWAAPLSGLKEDADIGWYSREISVPAGWNGRRVFLVVGASDWKTTAWLDGKEIGAHQGGYTPFSFELTPHLRPGQSQRLVIRVDDTPHAFKLEGKQGYGNARGIWQTVYLEARGRQYLEGLQISPLNIQTGQVRIQALLPAATPRNLTLNLKITGDDPSQQITSTKTIPSGSNQLSFELTIPNPKLWSLESPHLYQVEARLADGNVVDTVNTYFGMRQISVVDLPGTNYRYVALNGKPVYLQLALDQAYHPDGFYTFPSDEFTRNEVLMARQIGLNGLRVHVKVGLPRKLYWADRLGMLIMADVPNSWGEPDADMRREAEFALRQMIRRDFNHPSIFSWIVFNETWGLHTTTDKEKKIRAYLPETQQWVVNMYQLAKQLDPTRLVEDNSVCCGVGHTQTDLNSWHSYLPGWEWEKTLAQMDTATYPGSSWNFEKGYRQDRQPNINSEFGNVWGYEGSTGDVDWSWDYHLAVDAFRRHPRIAGWLYTEHHDVINEWNGYWRFDRTEKETGLGGLVPGMSLRDLHSPLYLATGGELSRAAKPGQEMEVPLFASFYTDRVDAGAPMTIRARLYGWDYLGREEVYQEFTRPLPVKPWMQQKLDPLRVKMPDKPAVAVLAITLEDATGAVQHRNFTTFVVEGPLPEEITLANGRKARLLSIDPAKISAQSWSQKQWNVLDGLKVNGAGHGYFEYKLPWPANLPIGEVASATLVLEAGAKQLYGKDRTDTTRMEGDYMRGKGTFDPSRNPNAYPMTDETEFPSAVTVSANGIAAGRYDLPDDPADHRGILSWYSQKRDRWLREAGSYGYLLQVSIPKAALEDAARRGELILRLSVDDDLPGGLAIYGSRFGRYPVNPTVVVVRR